MFNWIWEILYGFSKTIFRLIDGIVQCANTLCGLSPIYVNESGAEQETDLMTFLFGNDAINFAFKVSALLATILIVIFTVFMIIRTIAKDKAEGTPTQLAIKAFKTLLMFFFIPAVMIAFMGLGNIFIEALYGALQQDASAPGAYLFTMFAKDGGMDENIANLFLSGELNYYDTSEVSKYFNLSDFPFLFSWLAGGVVLFGIGSSMLIFVDRVLSLVILYIASPISVSTSIIDEGARFKIWRDQFLSKFIMGYGMIIAINIYALVCSIIMSPDITFFKTEGAGSFLDMLMRLLVIAGGALTMQKSMALVGNLVSQGAGSNELRDSMSAGALAKMAGGAATKALALGGKALKFTGSAVSLPFKPLTDKYKDAYSLWTRNRADKWLNGDKDKNDGKGGSSESQNNENTQYGDKNKTKDAINNQGGFKMSFGGGGNGNGNNNNGNTGNKNDAVNQAITNGGNNNPGNTQTPTNNEQPKGENNQ